MRDLDDLFTFLAKSAFRSKFQLHGKDLDYLRNKGLDTVLSHAADFIAATTTAEAARLSQRKLALLQLLHPAHLGHKFQVLHALR